MTFWKWSRTASANATADSTCPFPEGMAPSAVNDGVRGLMAAAAKYRDDVSGLLYTSGSSSALTLATNQGLVNPIADGQSLAFFMNTATNVAGATLNVDGIGAYPIQLQAGGNLPVPAGLIIQGGVYKVRYSTNPFPLWVLQGFFGQIYAIPIGGFMPYLSITPPNSSFVLPYGQPISRSIYATLFSMIGTTFGVGDGSTTFNIPDLRGRTIVGQDNMGGTPLGLVTVEGSGINGSVFGARGGAETVKLDISMLPSHRHSVGLSDPGHLHTQNYGGGGGNPTNGGNVGAGPPINNGPSVTSPSGTGVLVHDGSGNQNTTGATGSSAAHSNMPPSIMLPILLRVI